MTKMSSDVSPLHSRKSLHRLIFDVKLPGFNSQHGVCLFGMHY
jgi:hypothetical protein